VFCEGVLFFEVSVRWPTEFSINRKRYYVISFTETIFIATAAKPALTTTLE
jgi:hypothetical protein